jgi:hypothetical protein
MTDLDEILKIINQSSFSKEDKMYMEVLVNMAYVAGARDTIKERVEQIEAQLRLNEQPPLDELANE